MNEASKAVNFGVLFILEWLLLIWYYQFYYVRNMER